MNYFWEVLLQAKELGIDGKDITFTRAQNPSPYVEVAFDDLNACYLDNIVEINPFYRYGGIFHSLVNGELGGYPELEEVLFDILIKFLGELDIIQGLSKKEYYGNFLKKELSGGAYGKELITIIETFPYKQRSTVMENMVKLYSNGPSIELLRVLLIQLYDSPLLYLDTVDKKTLLVYVGKKETPELNRQIWFLLDLFVPLDYEIELFWDMHFGLVGIDETMVVDKIYIY